MDTLKFNNDVKDWSGVTMKELRASFKKFGIEHRKNSSSKTSALRELRNRIGYQTGLANSVAFKFPKHMVYVHKGVGKGVKVDQVATSNRKAKPWFNDVMDPRIEQLADVVSNNAADLVMNAMHIKIH